MKILIVEDSEKLRRALVHGLKRTGHTVDAVDNGLDGLDYAQLGAYDVVILDIMLPGLDGFTLLTELRKSRNQTHVLILSAKDQLEDRVKGLELGGDDYLVKPFAFSELQARIEALGRRKFSSKEPKIVLGNLCINRAERSVTRGQTVLPLTPGEYNILERLAFHPGQALSKEQLLNAIQGADAFASVKVVEVLICTLRKKLGPEAVYLKTVRGFGYKLDAA